MNMPCKCEETDESRKLKERGIPTAILRFIGGFGKKPRGPYLQYETGKVYEVNARFSNKEAYPYWEAVDEEKDEPENDVVDEDDDTPVEVEAPSDGLTTLGFVASESGLTQAPDMGQHEIFNGMDVPTLHIYISSNGGKVDKRWGRKRLIQEALKL